jgi:FkbM family methyltransferase
MKLPQFYKNLFGKSKKYYSQYQQDKILNQTIFRNRRHGVFCDVGAFDGITMSNTYFFEKTLCWNGICVEPLPQLFHQLQKARRCICINACAYNERRTVEFQANEGYGIGLSGIIQSYHESHRERIRKEQELYKGTKRILKLQTLLLQDLFDEFACTTVDYLTIDTEGSELEVLQGIDFRKVHINVAEVENNYPDSPKTKKLFDLLEDNNFVFFKTIAMDSVFVNKDLHFSFDSQS